MNKKRNASIILTLIIAAIMVAGGYFVFIKQPSVTQIQQPESSLPQDGLDNVSTSFIGKWKVVLVQEGDVRIVPEGEDAVIEFFEDKTYKTSGGCNKMTLGSYEIQSGSRLSMSAGGTKRKCTKDIVEFWDLNKVYKYEFTDNILFLYYKAESGAEGLFKLQRISN